MTNLEAEHGRNRDELAPQLSRLDQDLTGLPEGLASYIRRVEYPNEINLVAKKWRAAMEERPTDNLAGTLSRWANVKLQPKELAAIASQEDDEIYAFFAEKSLDRARPWNKTVRNIALNTSYGLHHLGPLPAFYDFYIKHRGMLPEDMQSDELAEFIKQSSVEAQIHGDEAQRLLTTASKAYKEKPGQQRDELTAKAKQSVLLALFERQEYDNGLDFLGQHPLPTDEHYAALAKPPAIDFFRGLELQKVSHMLTIGPETPFSVVRQVHQSDNSAALEVEGEYRPARLFPAYSMKHGSVEPYELLDTASRSDVQGEFIRVAQLREQGVLPQVGLTGSYIVREHDASEDPEAEQNIVKNPDSVYIELIFPPNPNKPYKEAEHMYTRVIGGPEQPFRRRSILTGMCLFNGYSATVTGESGTRQPITDYHHPITERVIPGSLVVPDRTTVYEDEALLRLPYTIDALSRNMPVDTIHAIIPGAEYYHYILDAFKNGHVGKDDALQWFDAVDKRQMDLEFFMGYLLARRLNYRMRDLRYNLVRPLDALKPYIRQSVEQGRVPDIHEEIALLKESRYGDIFNVMLGVHQPQTYQDINFMSYSASQLNACGDNRLVYSVMDPKEATMQTRTEARYKDAARRAGIPYSLIGLYPLEEVVAEQGSNSLYHLPLFTDPVKKEAFLEKLVRRYEE